jgi:hypothetical protein
MWMVVEATASKGDIYSIELKTIRKVHTGAYEG